MEFDLDGDFYSLSVGPSYRLGDSTIYGLIGGSYSDVEIQASGVKKGGSGIGVSYGLGMRFTPVGNLVIDSSWERSRVGLSDVDGDANIFTIGLGVTY
ncbi:Outer membrane protein X precursor [compost metagenome]